MINIGETSTISEVFFEAAQVYASQPFLMVPANPAEPMRLPD